jgi:hypothetical protein
VRSINNTWWWHKAIDLSSLLFQYVGKSCKTGTIKIWVNLNTNLLISTDKHVFIPHEDEDADSG